ncbi:hypothetical protein [Dyadobacter sp. 3J3]|uniref:hypothetical protein n=1 Tax=Dyadobacter sp. 3J3 TaxID=2606600 RepID=UPI00135AEA7B|nr:hypothetical protein [Dyadobacter sp. 3J3]
MKTITDLKGKKFGDLEVIKFSGYSNSKKPQWVCVCSCGKQISVNGADLKAGKSKTCGCKRVSNIIKRCVTHGLSNRVSGKNRLYSIWKGIKKRCYNQNEPGYKNYGGRGITMCDEWMDYMNFHLWATGNGYSDILSIERIRVNENYCPDNCKWATTEEQSNNTRRTIFLEHNGIRKPLSYWAKDLGVSRSALWNRLQRMSFSEAIIKPYRSTKQQVHG